MLHSCELIAALKIRSTNRRGKQLSTPRTLGILEEHGVEVDGKRITSPKGLLTKSTINRYLKHFGMTSKNFRCESVVVSFQATYSNEYWQLDFTPSNLKRLPNDTTGETDGLILASVVDDRSGVMYQEYHASKEENVLMALRFLFNESCREVDYTDPYCTEQ
jgi:hypothetical protein